MSAAVQGLEALAMAVGVSMQQQQHPKAGRGWMTLAAVGSVVEGDWLVTGW
jgi:hypothetical protein